MVQEGDALVRGLEASKEIIFTIATLIMQIWTLRKVGKNRTDIKEVRRTVNGQVHFEVPSQMLVDRSERRE